MKTITVGIIGAGRIGKLHTTNILHLPGVRLKTVADPEIDEEWAGGLGIGTATDHKAILSDGDIDAVLICSPSPTHAEIIGAAARAKKHIFCEKPIALDPRLIEEVLRVVARENVKLQIGFNRRFDPDFVRLKQTVEDGKVGRIYLIKITSRDPAPPSLEYIRHSGGLFLDMTVHDFDMVRFLSGSEVEEVYAAGAVLAAPAIGELGDVDTAVIILKLKNESMAVIDNSRQAVYGYDQRVEVFGSKGSMAAFNRTPTQTRLSTADGVFSDNPHTFFRERYHASYFNELEAFIASIRDDRDPPVSGRDGLMPILIGLAAKRSLAERRPVKVNSD